MSVSSRRRLCLRRALAHRCEQGELFADLPAWIAAIHLGFLPSTIVAGLVCVVLAFLVGAR